MGLPSGIQWANCNVGAKSEVDFGQYFSWGNTEGHNIDEEYDFSQNVYNSTPAADIATDLSLEQDAARAILGAPWRMPTAAEFQELVDNCTSVWTTLKGMNGLLFTSNVNGKKLFFPAAGIYNGTLLNSRGVSGNYWSSTYNSATGARYLGFNSSNIIPQGSISRRYGCNVRAVMNPV